MRKSNEILIMCAHRTCTNTAYTRCTLYTIYHVLYAIQYTLYDVNYTLRSLQDQDLPAICIVLLRGTHQDP